MRTKKLFMSAGLSGLLFASSLTGLGVFEAVAQENADTQNTSVNFQDNFMDLSGDWYFNAYKGYTDASDPLDSIQSITPDVYTSWGIVQPGLDWWTSDFDDSLGGNQWYAGYAWYVRTFTMEDALPEDELVLSVGSFDESNEVYLNGQFIGSTGVNFTEDGIGVYDGSNPWEVECAYAFDKSILNAEGENTIAVRMCNSSGGGGWYKGPIGIFTKPAFDAMVAASNGRFLVSTYASETIGDEAVTYRIYLPEEYETSDKSYPVLYMLHGINSSGKSYVIDKIDDLLEEAIANGKIDPIIVVLPDDPSRQSFWLGAYGDMVANDLVSHIDSTYRTLADSQHRYIGGCSMGGGGAVSVFSLYPDKFDGLISFYGAFRYVDAENKISSLTDEELKDKLIYMACGDKDEYGFFEDQTSMDKLLTERGVEHYHEINDGTHSSEFYLPRFIDAIKFVTGK